MPTPLDARHGDRGAAIVPTGYFRRHENLYTLGTPARIYAHQSIVTTPEEWSRRPEALDPAWVVQPNAEPLLIAFRLDG